MRFSTQLKLTICALVALVGATGVNGQAPSSSPKTGVFGEINKGLYTNSVFGFEIQIPSDWIAIDNEDAKEFMKAGIQAAQLDEKELERNKKYRVALLSVVTKPMGSENNATVALSAMKQPSNSVKLLTLAELTRGGLAKSPAIKFDTNASVVTIGGKEFATFDYTITIGDRSSRGKYLVTMVRDYSITFFLTHENPKDGPAISKVTDSIKFY